MKPSAGRLRRQSACEKRKLTSEPCSPNCAYPFQANLHLSRPYDGPRRRAYDSVTSGLHLISDKPPIR